VLSQGLVHRLRLFDYRVGAGEQCRQDSDAGSGYRIISHQGALANAAPQWARTGDSTYGSPRAITAGSRARQKPWLVFSGLSHAGENHGFALWDEEPFSYFGECLERFDREMQQTPPLRFQLVDVE
jgi:hypothetical protein